MPANEQKDQKNYTPEQEAIRTKLFALKENLEGLMGELDNELTSTGAKAAVMGAAKSFWKGDEERRRRIYEKKNAAQSLRGLIDPRMLAGEDVTEAFAKLNIVEKASSTRVNTILAQMKELAPQCTILKSEPSPAFKK